MEALEPQPFWPYVLSMQTPILPPCLAVTCLFLNFFLSGCGTLVAALTSAAHGQRRNLLICAALQFFFLWLILPWWWAVSWGIVLVINTRHYVRPERHRRGAQPQPAAHQEQMVGAHHAL
ncbi:Spec3 membrane protein [Giardia muris]|uniref:Spec3 membrane protein n=1 Tax=Giardia muris TaxID=5742 RepID=A0A4Z1T2E6_GIAMU|nr:Spec3 membrane protein [Giardia muris]|eukprot:TNJ27207.1 Spec3 membrane protein [Giardia muris]